MDKGMVQRRKKKAVDRSGCLRGLWSWVLGCAAPICHHYCSGAGESTSPTLGRVSISPHPVPQAFLTYPLPMKVEQWHFGNVPFSSQLGHSRACQLEAAGQRLPAWADGAQACTCTHTGAEAQSCSCHCCSTSLLCGSCCSCSMSC
jgi:hypothetical protein